MIIHKILHTNLSLEATCDKLMQLWGYRHHLSGVQHASIHEDGSSYWQFDLGNGIVAEVALEYFAGDQLNEVFFRSVDGNVDVVGRLLFTAVRDQLTEVDLLMEVEFESRFARMVDGVTHGLERCVDRQLHGVRNYLAATVDRPSVPAAVALSA